MFTNERPRIAILASGSGTTAEAFIRATQDGRVMADVALVICNNPPEKAGVHDQIATLNRQYGLNITTVEISGRTHPAGNVGRGQTLAESAAICDLVRQHNCAHVALMGYMKLIRGALVEAYGWQPHFTSIYQGRMSNTHPGPLPETEGCYGLHIAERVLALGLAASKHTIHLVAPDMDRGPKIAEHSVGILPGDTPEDLLQRTQIVEKAMLPLALDNFLQAQAAYLASEPH